MRQAGGINWGNKAVERDDRDGLDAPIQFGADARR